MAFSTATSPISDRGCDQKEQKSHSLLPLSPELTDPSDNDSQSTSHTDSPSASEDHTDRETIEDAFQVINASFCGLPTQAYPLFHFQKPSLSFHSLQERLEKYSVELFQFFENQVRSDWNADTGDLLLRLMPTRIHECFIDGVVTLVRAELDRIAKEDPKLAPFRSQIFPAGSATVTDNNDKTFRKSPDAQFIYSREGHPPFLLEVAYSQEGKKILSKSNEYFRYLPGCTVLSFDLAYALPATRLLEKHVHDGCVSWATSNQVKENGRLVSNIYNQLEDEVFRRAGKAVKGEVVIPFARFVPLKEHKDLPESAEAAKIYLRFADLADLFTQYEKLQRDSDKSTLSEISESN